MLSRAVQELVTKHERHILGKTGPEEGDIAKIHVDEIASKVATFYDKVRNLIEYHDAHLLRKSTIERILRRRIFLKDFDENFAEALIKELIRSGHLPNNSVPESKIGGVQQIIDNLLFLLRRAAHKSKKEALSDWLIKIFVPAIEEELFPSPEDRMVAETMYGAIKDNIVLKNSSLSQQEVNPQILIGTYRALFRSDNDQLQYMLLKFLYPEWGKLPAEELERTADKLEELKHNLETLIKNRTGSYFFRLCNKEKITFQLIGDLVFGDTPLDKEYDARLRLLYQKRRDRAVGQLRRLALFSVISFFISKMLVALAIEIPLDQYFYHSFSLMSMTINVLFPPFLMLLIVTFTRLPSEKNYNLVSSAIRSIVYSDVERKYTVVLPKGKKYAVSFFVYLAYALVLFLSLYYLVDILMLLKFSVISIVIFLLFTSMVIATGVKINNRSKEMNLEKEKATFFGFLIDLMIVPFMTAGKLIIAGLAKFNILVIIFNFLIELPFQIFVEFLENFREFIRIKKEEIS